MSSPEVPVEEDKLIKFKLKWYRHAGWTKRNAELLASDPDLDWHFVYDLRTKCDDEDLCMRIIYG